MLIIFKQMKNEIKLIFKQLFCFHPWKFSLENVPYKDLTKELIDNSYFYCPNCGAKTNI